MNSRHKLISLVGLILALICLCSSTAIAQDSSPQSPTSSAAVEEAAAPAKPAAPIETTATGTYSIFYIGTSFRPGSSNAQWASDADGSCVYLTAGDPTVKWQMPLVLPRDVLVTRLRFYFYDASADETTYAGLFRYGYNWGAAAGYWSTYSVGSSGYGLKDLNFSTPLKLDYANYAWTLFWQPWGYGSDLQLCGIAVTYQLPAVAYMPSILR